MVKNSADEIPKKNIDRKIINEVDLDDYHEYENLEEVEDYTYLHKPENFNLEESKNKELEDHKE